MDTVIGIFDADGNLLLADDDGGVGLLSRLLVQIVGGRHLRRRRDDLPGLRASPEPGSDFGRYVLNISSYRGTILPVGDDAAVEVPLSTFAFPFQGTSWSSVFVNGNGNLTFGAADADFTETRRRAAGRAAAHRTALGRLASLPRGLVIAEEKDSSLQIHFVSVPEFLVTGTNYFTVTSGSPRGDHHRLRRDQPK